MTRLLSAAFLQIDAVLGVDIFLSCKLCMNLAATGGRSIPVRHSTHAVFDKRTSRDMANAFPSVISHGGPIILFDAECVLCSANAQFVLKHDRIGHFRLASMQSAIGEALYQAHGMDPKNPSSILIVDGNTVRRDSDAVLSIYEALGFPWRLLSIFRAVPSVLRNPVYRWVARHRYRIFGKRSHC